ncbi:MAG: hypothetical protein V4577_29250 [Bacteroidota bacterium]
MKGFLLILSLLITCNLCAASKVVDGSLIAAEKQQLHKRIDKLNDAAYNIYLSSPDSARKLAENALLLSEKNNYQLGKGRSFYNIGLIYWSQSYYTISLFYLNSAANNLPKDSKAYLSDCFNALGRTYADLGNYTQAMIDLNKSLELAGNDTWRLAEVFSEKSYVYSALKNYPKAIADAQYALTLNSKIHSTGDIAVLYARLAGIYKSKGDFKNALFYDDIAFEMSKTTGNKRLRAKTYIEYALINNSLNKYSEAIDYAQKGIALADSIGLIDAQKEGYKSLVNSFELRNDLKQALAYQKKYSILSDSISKSSKLKTAKLIQNYHTLNAKINDIKRMEIGDRENKAKIKAQTNLILFLSISLVVLIAALFTTWYLYKQKQLRV